MKRWHGFALLAVMAIAGCSGKRVAPAITEPKSPEPPAPQVQASCAASTTDALTKPGMVSVFFLCSADSMTMTPRAVDRRAPDKATELKFALEELLKGPTAQERSAGFSSNFSSETAGMLKSVTVSDTGRAVVDFADFSGRTPHVSTSAGSTQLIGELNRTVFQFKQVREAEYRIEGSCEAFWTMLQRGCRTVTAADANK